MSNNSTTQSPDSTPGTRDDPDNDKFVALSIKANIDDYNDNVLDLVRYSHLAHRCAVRALMAVKEAGGRAHDYANLYAAIYRGEAKIQEALKPLLEIFTELKTVKVPEAFENDNVKTLTMADGARISISQVVRASVVGGKKDQAVAYLRQNELGDLITETLNASTLSAFVKTLLEKNESLPSELFNVAVVPQVSLTNSKPKG